MTERHPSRAKQEISATFKLLLIGDSGTGKSSILLRFTDDAWLQPESVSATIGVDFKVKTINVDGKVYKLTIWDTAGQERFRTLTSSYYRGAQGVIMMYDVSNRESFDHLKNWFQELESIFAIFNLVSHNNVFLEAYAHPHVIKIIVGNKTDMELVAGGRQVSSSEGEAFAKEYGTLFIETSAKTTANVQDAFVELVRKIAESPKLWQTAPTATGVPLDISGSSNSQDLSMCAC